MCMRMHSMHSMSMGMGMGMGMGVGMGMGMGSMTHTYIYVRLCGMGIPPRTMAASKRFHGSDQQRRLPNQAQGQG